MDRIGKLALLFAEFPGIGTRQSRRFVYFLLRQDPRFTKELVDAIEGIRESVSECARCHRYFTKKRDDATRCTICSDGSRDKSLLMVVEKDADLEAIERSGTFLGRYFVLGGSLPILAKETPTHLRTNELRTLLSGSDAVEIAEVIIACAMTPEGEHTAEHIRDIVLPFAKKGGFRVTMLGRGLSTGTELEYSDGDTIRWALEGRK